MTELASTLSPNHRLMPAEYRRVGYLANGWNAVRRWNSRTAALETAGIEGPDSTDNSWTPMPTAQGSTGQAFTHKFRNFRYRYKDSTTGYVSEPSAETVGVVTDGRYSVDNSILNTLRFLIGAPTAVLGPGNIAIVNGGPDTLTRAAGSWVDDGFALGDYIEITNAEDSSNNGIWGPISLLTATVMTIHGDRALPVSNAADTTMTWRRSAKGRIQPSTDPKVDTIVLEATLETLHPVVPRYPGVAEAPVWGPDATGLVISANKIERTAGSWVTEGFAVGDFFGADSLENLPTPETFRLWGPIVRVDDTVIYFASEPFAGITNAADTTARWRRWKNEERGGGDTFFLAVEASNDADYIDFTDPTDAGLEAKVLPYPDYGHQPPPITKNVLSHRDRLWYYGQVVHSTGNCDVTNGSANVDEGAVDPDWNTEVLGSEAGDSSVQWLFQRDGDAVVYEISYYDSANNRIILKTTYAGVTGTDVGYKIFSQTNVIWVSEPSYPESFDLAVFINGPAGEAAGDMTAAVGYGGSVLFFSGSAIHRFSFASDPYAVDGSAAMIPLTNKAGALSQRVVIEHEGYVYTMDRRGWHRFDGVTPTLISRPLGNILPSIDFDYADRFHACFLPDSRAIRWWITYSGDTYPKNYVQFDLDTGAWSTGTYLQGITDSRLVRQGDGMRLFLIDENGHEWWGDTGLADGCPAANSHLTAAAGCTTTVMNVDETVPTTNVGIVGCYLSRRTTAGVFESRRISACTANTVTVASAFSEAPADGDLFWVGPIPSKLKYRAFGYEKDLKAKTRTGYLTIAFKPTSSARYLQVRVYEDYSATAKTWGTARGNDLPGLTKPGVNTRYPTSDWLVDLSRSDGLVSIPLGSEWKRYYAVELEINEPDSDFELIAIEFDGQALAEAGGV